METAPIPFPEEDHVRRPRPHRPRPLRRHRGQLLRGRRRRRRRPVPRLGRTSGGRPGEPPARPGVLREPGDPRPSARRGPRRPARRGPRPRPGADAHHLLRRWQRHAPPRLRRRRAARTADRGRGRRRRPRDPPRTPQPRRPQRPAAPRPDDQRPRGRLGRGTDRVQPGARAAVRRRLARRTPRPRRVLVRGPSAHEPARTPAGRGPGPARDRRRSPGRRAPRAGRDEDVGRHGASGTTATTSSRGSGVG